MSVLELYICFSASASVAIVAAGDADTIVTCRQLKPTRSLKTGFSKWLIDLERAGASQRDMVEFIGYRSNRTAQIEGDLDGGESYCGASAGLIKDILPAAEVVRQLVEGCSRILDNFS